MATDEVHISDAADAPPNHAIYFITGNPGLISFYNRFLNDISGKLKAQTPNARVIVYGRSLAGFEVGKTSASKVHSLEDQVGHVREGIKGLASKHDASSSAKLKVTLVGHSVGAYILLRFLEEHQKSSHATELPYTIEAGILLFPTIMDISKSSSGMKVSWPLAIPLGPTMGGRAAWAMAYALPRGVLRSMVAQLPAFKGAKVGSEKAQAVDLVVSFLESPFGVEQCMSMAAEEMRDITADRFDDAIWGSAGGSGSSTAYQPKLFFYFGSQDHWVANETRDALIAARAFDGTNTLSHRKDWSNDSRPWMEIDQHGTGHDFCIHDSTVISDKVAEYMRVIL